jgi:aconitate hydratase
VHLRDLWPTKEEVEAHLARSRDPDDYARDFATASRNPLWLALDAPATPQFPWDPASTALRRPPFASTREGSQLGSYSAWPLLVVGDDVTTDHISPASAIPPESFIADYLVEKGREAQRPQRLRLPARQLAGDGAGRLLQPLAREPARAAGAGGSHAARAFRRDPAGVGRGRALPADGRGGGVWSRASATAWARSRDWAAKGQRLLGIRACSRRASSASIART